MVGGFTHFLFVNIYKNRAFHLSSFVMFFLLITLVSITLLIKSSIVSQTQYALQLQPEFIVTKLRGGKTEPIDESLLYELDSIFGVNAASGRVQGRYKHPLGEYSFTVVGIDPFDALLSGQMGQLMQDIDLESFLNGGAIVGSGVSEFLKQNRYGDSYNFFLYDKGSVKVDILGELSSKYAINTNDLIILPQSTARDILGIPYGKFSDIALRVDNELEYDTIEDTIYSKYKNIHIISKEQMERKYRNIYDFKSGLLLSLSMVALLVLGFMLYFKYSHTKSSAKKEIGILRALGWSIKDVLKLKLFESILVASFTFMVSFIAAFIIVYLYDGGLFRDIFLGHNNLEVAVDFTPQFEISVFIKLFVLFVSTFCASVLIPSWKLAITSSKEAMK
ncbi:MAG: ABC transporter permease [Campylobacterota bacterium]